MTALFSALSLALSVPLRAQAEDAARDAVKDRVQSQVIAVLSADMAPYREALAGLRAALNQDIPAFTLPELPEFTSKTAVVVTFGQKAIQMDYPASVAMVTALAPGLDARNSFLKPRLSVHVSMTPGADILVAELKTLQPGLKRLGVIWARESLDFSVSGLRAAASRAGISLQAFRAPGPDGVPETLRSIDTPIDALWVPLDPSLLTTSSFEVIKNYALGNNLPLYVPTEKLVSSGASASVSSSFEFIGRTAGRAVEQILSLEQTESVIYPTQTNISLNLVSAGRIGLKFPDRAVNSAAQVIR